MLHSRFLLAALILGSAAAAWGADDKVAAPVQVRLDVSETPDLKAWGEKAKGLCEKWHPLIVARLQADAGEPKPVTIVFKKDMKGIAATSGSNITISAKWVREHPDDFGMVIHELTHVVQAYPKSDPVWLVEGLADYIRYYHFEPGARRPRIDPVKSSYREGYGTAAAFLAWIEKAHDKKLIARLNRALRDGTYKDSLFKDSTGKDLDTLWKEFVGPPMK